MPERFYCGTITWKLICSMGVKIKDAELVKEVTGEERIPVSDGSGQPKAMTTEQMKGFVGVDKVTEQTVTDWGFTKNKGDYSKPSSGIPSSDMAKDVRNSLGKADTALQQHQSLANYATKQYVTDTIQLAITNALNTEV